MKREFDIKFRPQIESGEYKVQTRDGRKARIICWDRKANDHQIVVLVTVSKEEEIMCLFNLDGKILEHYESDSDLFVVTPEPELTEFEATLLSYLSDDTSGELDKETMHKCVKARAEELLAIAKKELFNGWSKCFNEYWLGRKKAIEEVSRVFHYEGPTIPTFWPICPSGGGQCTNPMRDCINCPLHSTNVCTNTGTSTSKVEGK